MLGPLRNALRIAMDEAIGGIEVFDELRAEPESCSQSSHVCCCSAQDGGLVSRSKIEERLRQFARAEKLVSMGELSSARQVLEEHQLGRGRFDFGQFRLRPIFGF